MSSDEYYSTDDDRHHYSSPERKTPQLSTPIATAADRLSPLPHAPKRLTPLRTPVHAPASPGYLYSSSDTETTDTDDTASPSSYSASSLSPASSHLATPRQHSPSLLYDRPTAPVNEATPLLPPLKTNSSLRSVFAASDASVEAEAGELVQFMVGVDMELQVFVLRVVCVVLASVAIVSVSAEFTTLHVLLTSPVVIFALAAFFNANSNSTLLRHLLLACTVLCVLELANILVSLLFSELGLAQRWYDAAVCLTLLVAFALLFDNKRTRDRLTQRYVKQYAHDRQRRDEEARDEADGGGGGRTRRGSVTGKECSREGRRWSGQLMRERSLSMDDEERRRVAAVGRGLEGVADSEAYEKHKPVSILDILQPSKDNGSEASLSPV